MVITDEMIERAAKALHTLCVMTTWRFETESRKEIFRSHARAALEAALSTQETEEE